MAEQNFIAKALCNLGGDVFTKESTEASLQRILQEAHQSTIHLDIQTDKWVFFSDHHKGAKNGADDFQRCEENYVSALNIYFEQGYSLCVMGDAEELWEEFPRTVIRHNSASFTIEKRYHDKGRYMRLWGNHDEIWGDPKIVRRHLQPLYGHKHLDVPESVLMEARDGKEKLGSILLIHGHQGTQNEGKSTKIAKWFLHNIWRPIQILTGFSCNTPATDWQLRRARDVMIYQWVVTQPGLVLISGHTHAPVFESYTHRARLIAELSDARANIQTLSGDKRNEETKRIEKLSSDLQALESSMSTEEKLESEPLENPLPCYFNTGCCAFADGDITGIEIADGEIRLVRWPDDNDQPIGKVLQSESLIKVFEQLR